MHASSGLTQDLDKQQRGEGAFLLAMLMAPCVAQELAEAADQDVTIPIPKAAQGGWGWHVASAKVPKLWIHGGQG